VDESGKGTGVPSPMLLPNYLRPETLTRRHESVRAA
jgi:hypothetical protein